MKIFKTVKRAIHQSKVFRYRTYKKISGVGHRELTDRIFFATMFSLLTLGALALFFSGEEKKLSSSELVEQRSTPSNEQEIVHEDLGDEPVIEEAPTPSLTDLENKVILKEAVLKTSVRKNGETFSSFLKKS